MCHTLYICCLLCRNIHLTKVYIFIFQTTRSDRAWLCNPFAIFPGQWWLALATSVPAALATILIFLDQQITGVIVNRAEHKLLVRIHPLLQM